MNKTDLVNKILERGTTLTVNELFGKKVLELREILGVPKPKPRSKGKVFKPTKRVFSSATYKEIIKLQNLLIENNIPYMMFEYMHGFVIRIAINIKTRKKKKDGTPSYRKRWIDCVEHDLSIGYLDDRLEIQGALTKEEEEAHSCNSTLQHCLTNLTAEEVFKRWKYCIDNETTIYSKEGTVGIGASLI